MQLLHAWPDIGKDDGCEFCFWHLTFCAIIFASISPKTTRSAESTASSSSDKQFASWQAIVDRIYRLLQFDIATR